MSDFLAVLCLQTELLVHQRCCGLATSDIVHSGSVCLSEPSSTQILTGFFPSFSSGSKNAFAISLAVG